MSQQKFYKLEAGRFAQYKYAWYETTDGARSSDETPVCPECGGCVGMCYWIPPFDVVLKQPRNVGDFISGAGGPDLLVSERLKEAYEKEKMTGFDRIFPVNVKKMGTTKKSKTYDMPKLYGVYFVHSRVTADYNKMGVVWTSEPNPDICQLCGPGGGGEGGIVESRQRIVLKPENWEGYDFFIPMNLCGNIILSGNAVRFIKNNGFTNAQIIPCEEAGWDPMAELDELEV